MGEEDYLLGCYRYIEINPVRAEMVAHPGEYRWSSYGVNAQGESDTLISTHVLYLGLGLTDEERQAAYRELFRYEIDSGLIDEIRRITHGGLVFGSDRFAKEVVILAGRRTQRGLAGRHRKVVINELADSGHG